MGGYARGAMVAAMAGVLLTSGCASNETIRNKTKDSCSLDDMDCHASLELSESDQIDSRVAIAYVEIDDQGLLRERGQLDRVLKLIEDRGKNKSQTVMTFIHGWHHNALADDENVKTFRRVLKQYSRLHQNEVVTGVYVGWRGTAWRFSNYLTFWRRKQVSIDIGQGALVDVISTVEKASIETRSRMISIGHSFGGSALFNSIHSLLLSRLDSPPAALQSEEFPMHAAVGDLVVIINPAFEAMQYWTLYSALLDRISKRGDKVALNRAPRMLIMQGQRDWATRYAFPTARLLNVPFEAHASDADSMDFAPPLSEWNLDLFAVGHFKEINTHDMVGDKDYKIDKNTPCGSGVDLQNFDDGNWRSLNSGISLKRRPNYVMGNPFWVVYDEQLSRGHNDLENPRLTCMLADLISSHTKTEFPLFDSPVDGLRKKQPER